MKKLSFLVLTVVMLFSLSIPVNAQSSLGKLEASLANVPAAQGDSDTFTFLQLGFTETRLLGPFDSAGIQVSFPEEWAFSVPGLLHLNYSVSIVGQDVTAGMNVIAGEMDISVNGSVVAILSLNQTGEFEQDITIPASYLVSARSDGRMDFSFDLISQESCTRNIDVNLIIHETSYLNLPHSTASPLTDLTLLPRPFYQPDMLIERTAVLVMPDDPTPGELQAVMDVAAGFGSLSSGKLLLQVVSSSNLTSEQLKGENLILVGKPSSLSTIKDLTLPMALQNNAFNLSDANDGVLQLIVSPWNNTRAILLVSGNSDEGVIKAGQAVKSGTILTTSNNSVSLIEDYRTEVSAPLAATDRSFADLSYADRNLKSAGINNSYVEFFIPAGQTVSQEAYLNLHYTHSSLLDFTTSGMTIILNGRVIGSIKFNDASTQSSEVQIKLPQTAFVQGTNQLQIQAQLVPLDDCTDNSSFTSVWESIFNDSMFHLPLESAAGTTAETLNLSDYPENLAMGDVQGNLTFILPKQDAAAWVTAAGVAFSMGNQLDAYLSQINVQFPDTLNSEVLAAHNVVLFGVPSKLQIPYDLGDALPAPFEKGSDIPTDKASRVVYRVAAGSDVGYIELFASLWGTDKIAMLVSGNTENGLALAGSALSGADLRGSLAGNFAIISSGQIVSLDARYPVSTELLAQPAAAQEQTAAQTPPSQAAQEKMSWMIPAILIVTALTFAVILLKLLPVLRGKPDKGEKHD
jgi:hypothetical protein